MYSGTRSTSHRRKSPGAIGSSPSRTTIYAAKLISPVASGRARHHRLAHRLVPYQGRLDLAEFHAESADLHLVIDSPQAFERPVGSPSSQIARPVESTARRVSERIGDEPLGRQRGSLPIAASASPAPPMYSSPMTPDGHRRSRLSST